MRDAEEGLSFVIKHSIFVVIYVDGGHSDEVGESKCRSLLRSVAVDVTRYPVRSVNWFRDIAHIHNRADLVRAAQVWRVNRHVVRARPATGRGAAGDLTVDNRPKSELRHGGFGPQTVWVGSFRDDALIFIVVYQSQRVVLESLEITLPHLEELVNAFFTNQRVCRAGLTCDGLNVGTSTMSECT